jgi:hypothetical protein
MTHAAHITFPFVFAHIEFSACHPGFFLFSDVLFATKPEIVTQMLANQ